MGYFNFDTSLIPLSNTSLDYLINTFLPPCIRNILILLYFVCIFSLFISQYWPCSFFLQILSQLSFMFYVFFFSVIYEALV